MPAPEAVGRDAELAEVDAFLGGLPSSSGALAIEGEPGIGKTTIWQAAIDHARAAGATVLACRPAAAEAKLSFSGLSDMLAEVDEKAFAALPSLQRNALEVALLRSAPEGPTLDPRLVATAVLSLVRALAAEHTVLLAVDDAQWLDGPTASVLAFAARRVERDSVGVLCAFRPDEEGLGLLASVERERIARLRLGPLALAPLGQLIAGRLGRTLPRPLLARIAEASRGNPFHALEVARLVQAGASAAGTHLPVPDDLRTLAASRVAALRAETQSALLRAAVLAAPETRTIDPASLAPAEEVGIVARRRARPDHVLAPAVRRRHLRLGVGGTATGRTSGRGRRGRRPGATRAPSGQQL